MQRRVATSSSSGPSAAGSGSGSSSIPAPSSRFQRHNQRNKNNKRKFNPVILLMGVAVTIMCLSWWLFPDEVVKVEHEAEYVGHRLAEEAIRAEHNVEDWIHNSGNRGAGGGGGADRAASEAASAAMLAQSSNWVEGEKKLKKKLAELYDKQQQGELLGVPVLTRWLGDDFPAWVTPDMDEAQWRKDVAAKYKEMREEEERWKLEMEKVIQQRERDLGITTP